MKTYFSCRSTIAQTLLALVLFSAAGSSVVKAATFGPEATNDGSRRTLTFAERVAYQRAVEEVYWRHRIWPKENPGPKPSLDKVMSQAQIEQKVEEYLHNSQLLAEQWRRPIISSQLQAEIERMASHTRQPDVLRELFAALGNDPFIVAECLARPILSERLVSEPHARANPTAETQSPGSWAAETETEPSVTTEQPPSGYYLPEIARSSVEDVAGGCADTWNATSTTGVPDGRAFHTAVWTGTEMIVWGGFGGTSGNLNTGGRYNPSTDSWVATTTSGAPEARRFPTAVWTGTEMIVWGGLGNTGKLKTGGRYNPSTDSWVATTTNGAPTKRWFQSAVWSGTEMIVWGGEDAATNREVKTGGRYNPSTDSWLPTATRQAPDGRVYHSAVWTGSEMIVWGGYDRDTNSINTGGRYNPSADSWVATTITGAPDPRYWHTAVWTGTEMIVWGGASESSIFNTGGKYNPGTNSWIVTTTTDAPDGRSYHTAVWTGTEMIVWGGRDANNDFVNSGGKYNPATGNWVAMTTTGAPDPRYQHTAVWTGSEMIVWGGRDTGGQLNTGGRYSP